MALLVQFLLRLTFGLAIGMMIVSQKKVTSGYFRNNLYVMLGLTSLAAVLSRSVAPDSFWYAVGAAAASYAGAVCWLYEKRRNGMLVLFVVALTAHEATLLLVGNESVHEMYQQNLYGAADASVDSDADTIEDGLILGYSAYYLSLLANASSGSLLGITMAAMLLGHWYLNSPTMELAPLKRLLIAMFFATALQASISALGLWGEIATASSFSTQWIIFVALRWTFGLLGVAILAGMAWQTLKIPNTQSATGILYVAVIGTFVGETMALLLSTESLFPL